MDDDRIEFEFPDLFPECEGRARQSRNQADDRCQIDRFRATKAGQQAGGFERPDHARGLGLVDRRGGVNDVAEQLHRRAAKAQHHDRAEGRVVDHADDQFVALGRHALDQDAVDRCVRRVTGDVGQHGCVGFGHRFRRCEVQPDATSFSLMRKLWRLHFQYDRKAKALCCADGFFQ